MDAHNGGVLYMRIMELCKIFGLVIEYLHHFDEDQDPDPH
jgi:hypothetical protein